MLFQLKESIIVKSKQETQLILSILSKLGLKYAIFVSTFHTTKLVIRETWRMSTPNAFIESLIHEWDKLINMGTLKSSKAHALDVH